jgi:hypothetical protein
MKWEAWKVNYVLVVVSQSMRICEGSWCAFSSVGQFTVIANRAVWIITDMFISTQNHYAVSLQVTLTCTFSPFVALQHVIIGSKQYQE